jgi:biotin transport system permease protein
MSPLDRLPAGLKLAALAFAGTVSFFIADWRLLALALLACLGLAALTGRPWPTVLAPWRLGTPVLVLVALAQGLGGDWLGGFATAVRLATLLLLAGLVTLTTRQSDMVDAIAAALRPLRHFGLKPDALALALSLALRLLPLIAEEAALVRDAQRARGLDRHPVALFVPLIVRVLKMGDDLAEAIDARSGSGADGS